MIPKYDPPPIPKRIGFHKNSCKTILGVSKLKEKLLARHSNLKQEFEIEL